MKKKLEAELISIAHRILQGIDKSSLAQLHEESRQVYEKLTILTFSESHFAGPQPTIGQIKTALESIKPETLKDLKQEVEQIDTPQVTKNLEDKIEIEVVPESAVPNPEENIEHVVAKESKPELVIEEINARVTTADLFVPANPEENVSVSELTSEQKQNNKVEVNTTFDTIDNEEKPKSLNDQLRRDIHIGLNDRLAFIKYLFDGSTVDYNRVLSQLNTFTLKTEAEDFVKNMVKPDYNNWEDKKEYEERFMDIVLSKFES